MQTRQQQREYRARVQNAPTKRYERTKKGFLVRKYRNMMSRVAGIQKKKAHLYSDMFLLPREEFYDWAFSSDQFNKLFCEWEESGYDRRLCPSVDRVDSAKGYSVDNMEWVTHSENSRRGAVSRWSGK